MLLIASHLVPSLDRRSSEATLPLTSRQSCGRLFRLCTALEACRHVFRLFSVSSPRGLGSDTVVGERVELSIGRGREYREHEPCSGARTCYCDVQSPVHTAQYCAAQLTRCISCVRASVRCAGGTRSEAAASDRTDVYSVSEGGVVDMGSEHQQQSQSQHHSDSDCSTLSLLSSTIRQPVIDHYPPAVRWSSASSCRCGRRCCWPSPPSSPPSPPSCTPTWPTATPASRPSSSTSGRPSARRPQSTTPAGRRRAGLHRRALRAAAAHVAAVRARG